MTFHPARPLRVVLALFAVSLLAADWPRFRGPNGTGISEDKNIPLTWSPTENILWKVKVPGAGHSSPIVSGDRLFLQTSAEDGASRSLLCYQVDDGKLLWSYDVPASDAHRRQDNTLASSTPASDGKLVYTVFWDGEGLQLVACNFQGKKVWDRDLGSFTSQHGAGLSPVVYRGKVYLNNDQDEEKNDQDAPAKVQAFDAATGKLIWEQKRAPHRVSYSSPFLRETGKGPGELTVASTTGITGYHPDTGEVIWDWKWDWGRVQPLRVVGSPVANNGLVYAYTGSGGGSRMFVAVRAGTDLPKGTDRLAWSATRQTPYVPVLLSYGDYLYGIHDAGRAACFEAATGELVWNERLTGDKVYSSPVIIDGKVYATTMGGSTFVFPAQPKFELLAQNELDEAVFASPAVADGRLFIRGAEHLYCIGKAK